MHMVQELGVVTSVEEKVPSAHTLSLFSVETQPGQGQTYILPLSSPRGDLISLLGILWSCLSPDMLVETPGISWNDSDLCWTIEILLAVLGERWSESLWSTLESRYTGVALNLLGACTSRFAAAEDPVSCHRSAQLACQCLTILLRARKIIRGSDSETAACHLVLLLIQTSNNMPGIGMLCLDQLRAPIDTFLTHGELDSLATPDLRRALVCLYHLVSKKEPLAYDLNEFESRVLREEFEKLLPQSLTKQRLQQPDSRSSKRIRSLETGESFDNYMRALVDDDIVVVFGAAANSSSKKLRYAAEHFRKLHSEAQYLLLTMLADAVCSCAIRSNVLGPCQYCKNEQPVSSKASTMNSALLEELYSVIEAIAKQVQEQKTSKTRVASILTIRRVVAHSTLPQHFSLKSSFLGQICLQSLRSTLRDVRLAAISTLECFFTAALDVDVLRENRLVCLDLWHSLSECKDLLVQETCVYGLGLLARLTTEEDEMNMVLLGLLEYLGHSNAFISSMAYEELAQIPLTENKNLWQILDPYWRTLAVSIVKALSSRPQIAHSVCDLLGITVADLLKRTQFFTLPYLVYKGQNDVLQRIAIANGSDVSVHSLCFQHGQLASILCFLLLQPSEDSDSLVVESMSRACGGLTPLTLSDLLKCDTMYMAYELLKAASEKQDLMRPRALQLLHALADLSQNRSRSSRSSGSTKKDALGAFFETWALAIVQLLSETITNAKSVNSLFDRRRSIGALAEMAALAEERLGNALPQVSILDFWTWQC